MGAAAAQDFPARQIIMIVPFPAGGATDILARILAEPMRVALGQPVIVQNVTGAGSTIGVGRAIQSAPDGYTLSIGNWTSHVGASAVYQVPWNILADLLANQVDFFCGEASQMLPHMRAGRIKPLMVMSQSRWQPLPEVPTVEEVGASDSVFAFWNGLWVPKGTPRHVIAKLNAAAVKALADPGVIKRLTDLGQTFPPREQLTPDQVALRTARPPSTVTMVPLI